MFTYYDLLGVSPNASEWQIKRAYRKRVRKVHPDVVRSDDALRKVKLLNRAYAVLQDKQRRAEYDSSIREEGSYACKVEKQPAHHTHSLRWLILSMWWLAATVLLWGFIQVDILHFLRSYLNF